MSTLAVMVAAGCCPVILEMLNLFVTCVTCELLSKTQLGQEDQPGHGKVMVKMGIGGGC